MKWRTGLLAGVIGVGGFATVFVCGTAAAAPGAAASPGGGAATAAAGLPDNKSFKVTVYCPVGTLTGGGTGGRRGGGGAGANGVNFQQLENTWNALSKQIKIDKVYIETFRSLNRMPEEQIEPLKKFFTDRGVEVAGGMTLVYNDSNQFVTFDYEDAQQRDLVKDVSEMTARHFNEIILDDFFFYNTKSDADIKAKGDKTWSDYRVETMQNIAKNFVVGPAHAVNPKVKMVIKYPNWYEHFQGSGFDLDKEPGIFDGIYTGTETRDSLRTEQHLQPYESYQIIRYFDNIKPGGNGGGWVDTFQVPNADRYAEELWDTVFAKPPEMMLFNWGGIQQNMAMGQRAWADQHTSLDYDDMVKNAPPAAAAGAGGRGGFGGAAAGPSVPAAEIAGYALRQADQVVHQLGTPMGIASYRPPHGVGEDFLHNFLGMIGLPIDLHPTYPADAHTILLTADAAGDADLVKKIKDSLSQGKNVVITSGLVKALQGKGIEDICELRYTGNQIDVTSFQQRGGGLVANSDLDKPIIFPEIAFMTNDTWYVLAGVASGNGYPILISDKYSQGVLYVLTIPDNPEDLYRIPPSALALIRNTLMMDLPVSLTGNTPANIGLFEYDNGTLVVQNFADQEQPVTVGVTGKNTLQDLLSGETVQASAGGFGRGGFAFGGGAGGAGAGRGGPQRTNFAVPVKAHSWRAFKAQ